MQYGAEGKLRERKVSILRCVLYDLSNTDTERQQNVRIREMCF